MKLRWFQQACFNFLSTPVLVAVLMLATNVGVYAQQSTEDLAAAAQNPVAAMYSLPFQNNIYGGAGPNHNATANVLNIQPVLPFTVGEWNIISRTIAPLVYLPSLTTGPIRNRRPKPVRRFPFWSRRHQSELLFFTGPPFGGNLGHRAFLHSADRDSHAPRLCQV